MCILESVCLYIYKKPCWDFDWNSVKIINQFGGYYLFTMLTFPVHEHGMSAINCFIPLSFVFFSLMLSRFPVWVCLLAAWLQCVMVEVSFFAFTLLWVCWASWSWSFWSLLWRFGLFLQVFFPPSPLLQEPPWHIRCYAWCCPMGPWFPSTSPFLSVIQVE